VKDDRVYLQHIRDALDDIATYANAGREAFFAERMRQDATIRKLQVIGQAVKNLSDNSKSRQPHIPWKQIAGLRDKVIHSRSSQPNRAATTKCSGSTHGVYDNRNGCVSAH
jgi:uncharacterized protein with HEPN domain